MGCRLFCCMKGVLLSKSNGLFLSQLARLLSVCGAQKLQRLVVPATFDRGTNYAFAISRTASTQARYPRQREPNKLCSLFMPRL